MGRFGDWLLLLAGAAVVLWWLARRFDHWLHEPPGVRLRRIAQKGDGVAESEAVLLLRDNGFDVLSGKHKIPLGVAVDGAPVQQTRLFFDYLATKDDKYYLVKLERARQPIDWTPSGLRERLLVYALLFPDCEGIIVADPKDKLLRTVRFQVGDDEE